MAEFESVDDQEFKELMQQADEDAARRHGAGQAAPIQPMQRKLFFDKSFRPPIRRVPCLLLKIGGRDFNCPVLASYDVADKPTHKNCIILVVEKPRLLTTVALIPRTELETAPEVELPW